MAIQAVVAWKATHRPIDFRSIQKENLPLEVSIGRHLSANDDAQRQLALPLLKLTRSLEAKNPALAQELRKELWTWSVPEADQELMRRLTSCTPVLSDLTAAMTRRDSLVANHPSELAALAKGDGWRAALAAVLLNNQKRAEALLSQGDDGTRIALLASARMLRVPLNLGKVALLSLRSRDLAQAADAYLKAAKEF